MAVSGFLLQARAFKSSLNVNVTFKTTVARPLISRAGHSLQLNQRLNGVGVLIFPFPMQSPSTGIEAGL